MLEVRFFSLALTILASFAPTAPTFAQANDCDTKPSTLVLESESDALQYLDEIGFVSRNGKGSRNYHASTLSSLNAMDMAAIFNPLEKAQTPANRSLVFFFKLGAAAHKDSTEAACFVRTALLSNTSQLVTDLRSLSALIEKRPQNTEAPRAMLAIAREAGGEQAMAYLQDAKAVTYVTSGQGYGVNPNDARFNKKRMSHIPNEVMKAFAENIKRDDTAGRSVIYQIEHMGHKNGIPD